MGESPPLAVGFRLFLAAGCASATLSSRVLGVVWRLRRCARRAVISWRSLANTAGAETVGDLTVDLDRIIAHRDQLKADIEAAFLEQIVERSAVFGYGCCVRRFVER